MHCFAHASLTEGLVIDASTVFKHIFILMIFEILKQPLNNLYLHNGSLNKGNQ